MPGKADPMRRRPHRPNEPIIRDRNRSSLKVIYWTTSRLEKLLTRIIRNDREEWFTARVRALKSWPERTRQQNIEAASRMSVRWRKLKGRGSWPKSQFEIEREQIPPQDSIDADVLREVLADLDNRQGDRLVELLIERLPVREDRGRSSVTGVREDLPQHKEIGTPLLRRIKRLHRRLMTAIAGDHDGDLAAARGPEVPRANLRSPGWE